VSVDITERKLAKQILHHQEIILEKICT